MEIISSADYELRASLGYVKEYSKQNTDFSQSPPSNFNVLLDMYENDPVLATAIDTTVDMATYAGYDFIPRKGKGSDRRIREVKDMFDMELDFDQVIDSIIYSMLIYGDAFLELRYLDGKVKELHPLETTEMRICYDEHGKVHGYIQKSPTVDVESQFFKPEEVIHFRMKRIGSRVYSYTPLLPISKDFMTKQYARHYLSSIFVNFPPRLLYILNNATKAQTQFFISQLRAAKTNPNKDLLGIGDIKIEKAGTYDFSQGLPEILNYLRTEILMVTKVPPIWLGIPDNSNRGNSEAQIFSFETRIRKIQQKIESQIDKDLLPKLKFKNLKLKFNQFSFKSMTDVVEIAKGLKEIGLDDDTLLQWLKENRINLREGAKIEQPDPLQMMGGAPGQKGMVDKNKSVAEKSNLQQDGSSKAGQKKLDKANSKVRSAMDLMKDRWFIDREGNE